MSIWHLGPIEKLKYHTQVNGSLFLGGGENLTKLNKNEMFLGTQYCDGTAAEVKGLFWEMLKRNKGFICDLRKKMRGSMCFNHIFIKYCRCMFAFSCLLLVCHLHSWSVSPKTLLLRFFCFLRLVFYRFFFFFFLPFARFFFFFFCCILCAFAVFFAFPVFS